MSAPLAGLYTSFVLKARGTCETSAVVYGKVEKLAVKVNRAKKGAGSRARPCGDLSR